MTLQSVHSLTYSNDVSLVSVSMTFTVRPFIIHKG